MQKLNNIGLTIILAALTLPTTANAGSWICEHDNLMREISVQRETSDPAPCSVVYNKDTENLGSSVLWTAQHDGAYCDAKANGLAEKLVSSGWSCTEI
jgi:hypothetical protein